MVIENDEGNKTYNFSNQANFLGSNIKKFIIFGVIIFLLLIAKPFFSIRAGHVGVLFNVLTGQTKSYSQGTHFKTPFINRVVVFDVRTIKTSYKAQCASKDIQEVSLEVVLNHHLEYTNVNKLYVKVGRDYVQKIIEPAIFEAIKASTAQYPVENIIVNREDLRKLMEEKLKGRLLVYSIILESVNLVDINFSPEFNKIVEQKQIEEQKIKTAEYKRMQAEEEKKSVILVAEGEAHKQKLLKLNTSKEVIALKWIEKWNGELPQIMGGKEGPSMLITPKLKE